MKEEATVQQFFARWQQFERMWHCLLLQLLILQSFLRKQGSLEN
jgi:hypothetical protein